MKNTQIRCSYRCHTKQINSPTHKHEQCNISGSDNNWRNVALKVGPPLLSNHLQEKDQEYEPTDEEILKSIKLRTYTEIESRGSFKKQLVEGETELFRCNNASVLRMDCFAIGIYKTKLPKLHSIDKRRFCKEPKNLSYHNYINH